jgi:hypothetical protein
MSLGLAIFASVVLVLAVYQKQYRTDAGARVRVCDQIF